MSRLLLLLLLCLPLAGRAEKVLKSALAGVWYPADADKLRAQIEDCLGAADSRPALTDVMAVILPHAGYRWSGPTAGAALREIRGRHYRRVIVLGPSHQVALQDVASIPDATAYETPLGRIPLATDALAELARSRYVVSIPAAHRTEHSVQNELPLLQVAIGDFELIPIVVGQLDAASTAGLAAALRPLLGPDVLVVASSDFTHYGPNYDYVPFTDDLPARIQRLDDEAWELLAARDVPGFLTYRARTRVTICGRDALAVLATLLPETAKAHRLAYTTSGAMTDDYTNSVSYLAAAFTGSWPVATATPAITDVSIRLSAADKTALLRLARATLTNVFAERRLPAPEACGVQPTPAMQEPAGVFVTLTKEGRLRGCIGSIYPTQPLVRGVIANAYQAGWRDPRFPQLRPDEIADLHIEISVLTPPRPVADPGEIVVGRHGVILSKDGRRAVYLPQVAPEQGWDVPTMLGHLAEKAGLPADAWKEGATFDVFEADVFAEPEAAGPTR